MLCTECQELLSDYIDGLLELGEQAKIEAHISHCETCLSVRDDLLQIVHFSKTLPLHSPPNSVWQRIKADIDKDSKGRLPAPVNKLWTAMNSRGLGFRGEWATAIAIMLSLSTLVLVYQKGLFFQGSGEAAKSAQIVTATSQTRVDEDEMNSNIRDMEQRINSLKDVVEQRSLSWNPEIKSSFNRDMSYIDQTLAQCHHELTDDPHDDVCRELMLNAYREKVRLLEGFNDF